MVEGHTDNVPVKKDSDVLIDNWDLSVKRATAVVRVLQNDFLVDPSRMTAAGRSYYVPIDDNETWTGRAKNRRTRIVVLPKLDQFLIYLSREWKLHQINLHLITLLVLQILIVGFFRQSEKSLPQLLGYRQFHQLILFHPYRTLSEKQYHQP